MFDVIWTDPNRELVGEHRARKEKKREQLQKQKEREKSIGERSQSVHSGRSSSDHPFGFLLGRTSKKDKSSIRSKDSNTNRNSGLSGEVEIQATRAKRFSGQETSKLVQPLGPASYVTKQTEISSVPRTSGSENHDLSSEVCISSEGDTDQPITPPEEDR